MNTKALIPLVAGLAVAGLAAKLGLDYIQRAKGAQTKLVQVWAATEDIPRGVAIQESMLKPMGFPSQNVPPGAISDRAKLVGRVPRIVAPAGLPVLESLLLAPGSKPGLWVKNGFRAVGVKVDESSGVDNHLEPGCRVDVIGFFNVRGAGQSRTQARTIIENVEVAAVGPRLNPSTGAENKDAKGKPVTEKPARAVTLLVKPESVPLLHLAEQRGKIKLSMRGEEDGQSQDKQATADEEELFGEKPQQSGAEGEQVADWLGKMMESFGKAAPAPKEPALDQTPPVPPPPQYAWVMNIWNGKDRQVLGWQGLNSQEPQVLSGEGPNLFQDGGGPRSPHNPPTTPPATKPTPGAEPAQPQPPVMPTDAETEMESETEPEELNE